jgi:ATPase subunit of ABC transporter with duplicated ATPase domains
MGLMGPSGAGKTSLLAILSHQPHLLPKGSKAYGTVRLMMEDVDSPDPGTPTTPRPLQDNAAVPVDGQSLHAELDQSTSLEHDPSTTGSSSAADFVNLRLTLSAAAPVRPLR